MATIVNSSWSEGDPQADGRRYVTEQHVLSDGRTLVYEYLAEDAVDRNLVASLRAARLAGDLAAREAAEAEAALGQLPLTKLAFERRFTDAEWAAVQDFNAAYQDNPALTVPQKQQIRRGLHNYSIAQDISVADPEVQSLLGLYEAVGVLAPGRAAEVLTP